MTIEPWVYTPLFAIDHYSTSSTASLNKREFHSHSSNVLTQINIVLFAFPCCFPTALQPGGLSGLFGPWARTKTQAKSEQTPRRCFLSSHCRQNDNLARMCMRWQLETGHILRDNVREGHKERQWFLFPSMWQCLGFKRINSHTLWKDWICGHCFSFPDSINPRFVDLLRHRTRYFPLV